VTTNKFHGLSTSVGIPILWRIFEKMRISNPHSIVLITALQSHTVYCTCFN